jgi:hypothetical protein
MTTRKPKSKPAYSPLIEWPTEQLQLVDVTVEHEVPARAVVARGVHAGPAMSQPSPQRAKKTIH